MVLGIQLYLQSNDRSKLSLRLWCLHSANVYKMVNERLRKGLMCERRVAMGAYHSRYSQCSGSQASWTKYSTEGRLPAILYGSSTNLVKVKENVPI